MKSDKQNGFIDIHSHFLPFLDDGAENYDQCLAAARCYLSAGIDCVIATPHFIAGTKWTPTPEQILDNIKQTEKIFEEQEIPLKILPGMEIMVTEQICYNFDPNQLLSLGKKGFYLIEFPLNSQLSTPVAQGLQHLQSLEGIHFIIAHPERCTIFNDSSDWLELLVDRGILTQVNIGSLLGLAGKKVQLKACELLDAGLVHFLASDSHAKDNRMPPDSAQIEQLCSLLGEKTTNRALKLNPQRLLADKKVDPLISEGKIQFLDTLHAQHRGYMHKIKNLFTDN